MCVVPLTTIQAKCITKANANAVRVQRCARALSESTKKKLSIILQAGSNKAEESFAKLSDSEAQAVQGRVDVISYSVNAEINHFNQHRVGDYKVMMQKYLQGQISFYQNVSII